MPKPLNPYYLPDKKGLNNYFSYHGETYSNANEQNMIDSLVKEYIQQFGFNVVYLCRTPNNMDLVFGESAGSNFKESFNIEMMMEDYVAGFGNRDSVQPFGYLMEDNIELHVSFSRINEEIENLIKSGVLDRDDPYPRPGDLVYIPLYKCVMEIRFVESKSPNQPLGISVYYKLTCHRCKVDSTSPICSSIMLLSDSRCNIWHNFYTPLPSSLFNGLSSACYQFQTGVNYTPTEVGGFLIHRLDFSPLLCSGAEVKSPKALIRAVPALHYRLLGFCKLFFF